MMTKPEFKKLFANKGKYYCCRCDGDIIFYSDDTRVYTSPGHVRRALLTIFEHNLMNSGHRGTGNYFDIHGIQMALEINLLKSFEIRK